MNMMQAAVERAGADAEGPGQVAPLWRRSQCETALDCGSALGLRSQPVSPAFREPPDKTRQGMRNPTHGYFRLHRSRLVSARIRDEVLSCVQTGGE